MEIDVQYVAKLARIRLSPNEIKQLGKQLRNVLAYIDKLKEVDTKTIQPTSHPLPLKNVFRKDEVKPSLPTEEVLNNAPAKEAHFFKVPAIIE